MTSGFVMTGNRDRVRRRRSAETGGSVGSSRGWVRAIVLFVVALLWLVPLFVIFSSSLKTDAELYAPGGIVSFPLAPQWSNFVEAWNEGGLGKYMINSAIITAIKVPIEVFAVSLAAFALTRLKWRWAPGIFLLFLIGMVLPAQAALIPLHAILVDAGLINNWLALIAIYLGLGMPFGILIMRGYFNSIPSALDEAAMIDGASWFRIYWQIIMPLAWPAIATVIIFDSLFTWNEFIFAQLFITDDNLRPAQAGLLAFTGQHDTQFTLLNAGILISIAPVVLVYLIFQRRFLSGLGGAIKA